MNPVVIGIVFGIIAVAELPDKTMIAMLVLGSRSRPVLVWAGACGAFLVHVVLAVVAGRLIGLLPHRTIEIVTTALFFAGAVYLLAVPEKSEERRGEREAGGSAGGNAAAGGDAGAGGNAAAGGEAIGVAATGAWRMVATAFGVILVGELGDLTEVLTLNLAARYHQPVSVFIGAYAALVAVAALGAWGGRALLRWVPVSVVRRAGGVVLLGFTAYGVYGLLR
ncbi:MAG: TMEM165/GDT1 family protein [Acidimicrobiales bacterium]